jgi:hypothetical protein
MLAVPQADLKAVGLVVEKKLPHSQVENTTVEDTFVAAQPCL